MNPGFISSYLSAVEILSVGLEASQICLGNVNSFQLNDSVLRIHFADNQNLRENSANWARTNTNRQDYLLDRKMSLIPNHTVNGMDLFISGWSFWTTRDRGLTSVPSLPPLDYCSSLHHSCIGRGVLGKYLHDVLMDFLGCPLQINYKEFLFCPFLDFSHSSHLHRN